MKRPSGRKALSFGKCDGTEEEAPANYVPAAAVCVGGERCGITGRKGCGGQLLDVKGSGLTGDVHSKLAGLMQERKAEFPVGGETRRYRENTGGEALSDCN